MTTKTLHRRIVAEDRLSVGADLAQQTAAIAWKAPGYANAGLRRNGRTPSVIHRHSHSIGP